MSIGLLSVFSATYTIENPYSIFFIKQLVGSILGIIIYFLCLIPDYRNVIQWGSIGYCGTIILLLITLFKGSIGMGAQRWINLFFLKLQPSELVKIFFPMFIVYYLHSNRQHLSTFKVYAPIVSLLFFTVTLIFKQPDLGTAIVICASTLIIFWCAGMPKKFFIYGCAILIIATPYVWHIMKPYQKKRVTTFLGKGDVQKGRYQIEQAIIAVGSGGLTGKGFLNGTQNKFRFLPEGRTDFIFAVLSEELGFIGAFIIIISYTILFWRSCFIIQNLKDIYMQLCAFGMIIHIILSTYINICMVLNLLPIVGIPLPLISYGLSNLLITFVSFGLIQNIFMQRFYHIE